MNFSTISFGKCWKLDFGVQRKFSRDFSAAGRRWRRSAAAAAVATVRRRENGTKPQSKHTLCLLLGGNCFWKVVMMMIGEVPERLGGLFVAENGCQQSQAEKQTKENWRVAVCVCWWRPRCRWLLMTADHRVKSIPHARTHTHTWRATVASKWRFTWTFSQISRHTRRWLEFQSSAKYAPLVGW